MLRRNIIANYLGQGWVALMGLIFIPVYIRYLGIEAYGLIGLYSAIQVWLAVLDLGMTPALNRELARSRARIRSAESLRDLVVTFEIICYSLALAIGLVLWFASGWLATEWLNTSNLDVGVVATTLQIIGMVVALRFVEGLYRGGLLGLHRHVWLNGTVSFFATLRAVGAICILALVDPSIQAFFWWQAGVSLTTVLTLAYAMRHYLPRASRSGVFSPWAFTDVWRFAGGVLVTTILALLITQIDKILLSRMLSLETFGVYMFAATVAGSLYQLVGPLAQSYYPRFSELIAKGDESALADTYHQAAQLMTVATVPAGLLLIVFSEPILYVWTGDAKLARNASQLVAILALGNVLNGWMNIPYILQLASGWSSFSARVNAVGAVILAPAIFLIVPVYGMVGAAWVWVVVNLGYVLVAMRYMHRRLLPNHRMSWYANDLFIPSLMPGLVVALSMLLGPLSGSAWVVVPWVAATGAIAALGAVVGASRLRLSLFHQLQSLATSR